MQFAHNYNHHLQLTLALPCIIRLPCQVQSRYFPCSFFFKQIDCVQTYGRSRCAMWVLSFLNVSFNGIQVYLLSQMHCTVGESTFLRRMQGHWGISSAALQAVGVIICRASLSWTWIAKSCIYWPRFPQFPVFIFWTFPVFIFWT